MKASHPTRILTCCYCGARSTLPTAPNTALVCHGCGAPVSHLLELQPAIERRPRRADHARPAAPHPADRPGGHRPKDRPACRRKGPCRKGRKRKSLWKRLEDRAEDLADDLLDIFDLD